MSPRQTPVKRVQTGQLGLEDRGLDTIGRDLIRRPFALIVGVIQGPHDWAP